MQEPGSNRPLSTTDATGSWSPSEAPAPPSGADPPTVRTGQAAEAGSSSFRRRQDGLSLPRAGDRLESFELERAIGVGGMGAVYLATDTRLHREVALKILPPEQSNDSEVVQRFYQEGRAAARLDHENIARVFTIGGDKGYHFIAFEYIEGTTLRQRVHDRGSLPIDEAINYTLQIAGALVHASERGVVHRDIKPSNIIITPQGRAKLVDMGLARRFERGDDDGGLTQSGMTLGTFDYISPEQARDPRDVDVRGDLYSLGCTLFHMLTGRPPFPDGTVLQKLLQHQEEPPPDVRRLNPAVPEDLAAILVKLMAKDRERRYQTPELLVRDLLTVAGALGLRSLSPEGLVWMAPKAPPSWEKHLVWGIPAAALAAVVALLVWTGQPAEPTAAPLENLAPALPTKAQAAAKRDVSTTAPPKGTLQLTEAKGEPPSTVPPATRLRPRELAVRTGDELASALAHEASGSTLILSDDGPYVLPPSPSPRRDRRDLTIRAGADARPVLKFARLDRAATAGGDPALLAFGPGSVTIENLEFSLDAPDDDAPLAAIRAEGTDLILKRCFVRRRSTSPSSARQAAIQVRPDPAGASDGEHAPTLRAEACHLDGGIVGLWVKGAADLRLRDCTIGPQEPCFWLDNGGAAAVVPVELSLRNVSIRAGSGPVLQSSRSAARVTVERSVIAAAGDRIATLVAIDDPDGLDWRGTFNLYAGIETYLKLTRDVPGREPIRDFDAWNDDPLAFREVRSVASQGAVWEPADLASSPLKANPSLAFALRTGERPTAAVGARRGPRGRIFSADEGLAGLLGFALPVRPRGHLAVAPSPRPNSPVRDPMGPPPSVSPAPASLSGEDAAPSLTTGPTAPEITPMARDEDSPLSPMGRDPMDAEPADPPTPATEASVARPAPEIDTAPAAASPANSTAIRSASEFLAALERLGEKGGTLRIASGADLTLPSCELRGMGKWVIRAEAGSTRPRLRFRPSATEARRPARRSALFLLRSGSLELQGIDVVLEESEAPSGGAWAAFILGSGTDLSLMRCTVTIEGRNPRSAMVAARAGDDEEDDPADGEAFSAQVRATDCLLRAGGDLVDVAAGRRLDLEFTNVVVGAVGSLVHGHGLPRGQTAEPIKIVLRQVSARVEGGLAFLESAPGEPELPLAEVVARDVVLTTDGHEAPLIRIDGQEALEALRDRVKWEGHGVLYHEIEVYRLDQTARTGTLPLRFDRQSWDVAIAPREEAPFHGDVKFRNAWPPERSPAAVTRDDAALDGDGPAPTAGPDTKRIPPAPVKRAGTIADSEK